jgi:hypothetical protein
MLALAAPSCTLSHSALHHVGAPSFTCKDGLPIRLLVDERCEDGLCGYTCEPDRWKDEPQHG